MRWERLIASLLFAFGMTQPYAAGAVAAKDPESGAHDPGDRKIEQDEAREEEEEWEGLEERIDLYLSSHGIREGVASTARLSRLKADYARRRDAVSTKAAGEPRWISLGPTNGAGRMTSIAPQPTAGGTVYAGSAGGGVWKTEDGGATWTAITDDLPDLAVGAIALAPSAPNTLYLGTGEPIGPPGIGFLTSNDGGATWQLPDSVVASAFYRISVHPERPSELVAGTSDGGLRSTDGGRTWSRFLAGTRVTDIVRSAQDPKVLFAATYSSQIWKSEDGGINWTSRSTGFSPAEVRLSVAISASRPQTLYAACEIAGVAHVYKSVDGAMSWTDLASVRSDSVLQHFMGDVGHWANTIVVSPDDPDVVVAGGVFAIRSDDGGATWRKLPDTHVDFHDLRYQGSTLWLANDGGVWTSPDGGSTILERNAGLVTRQYYAVANDPFSADQVLGGAQDNGTSWRSGDGTHWNSIGGGDGFDCLFDARARGVFYLSYQYGSLERVSGTGPEARIAITPPFEQGEARRFRTVLVQDPEDSTLYTASSRIWRSTDAGHSWTPLPTTTAAGTWNAEAVNAIATAPSDAGVLMVGKGTEIYRTMDGGQSWTATNAGLPGAAVNGIVIDPTNAAVAYAALASPGGAALYMTSDAGAHWQARASGLPPAAALVVRIDPSEPAVVYCGTDLGVYRSLDRGASWHPFGAGLPATSVQDLRISADGSTVRVATYGRGVWELEGRSDRANRTPVPVPNAPREPRTVRGRNLALRP